jgi:ABC-type phosphate/phosphonate transport system substrate-binding protein
MFRFTYLPIIIAITLGQFSSAAEKEVLHVGMSWSLFPDVPPTHLKLVNQPVKDTLQYHTGYTTEVTNRSSALKVAKDIDDGKVQLGVFLGHEYAWAKQQYPDLEPLVLAVQSPGEVQAVFLVRENAKAKSLSEFKDARFARAHLLRDYANLYLEKSQAEVLKGSFTKVEKTTNAHTAIHKVIDGEADITLVECAAWNYFQKLYPGRAQNVKVLQQSEVFPPTVIVYKKNGLTEVARTRIREGLLASEKTTRGQTMARMIEIERFEVVPNDFEQRLELVNQAYPFERVSERLVREK